MKNIKELNEKKVPIVRIDQSLELYKDQPIFQEKVNKANQIIENVGLPNLKKRNSKGNT
jgi:hypothetical protein